VYYRIIPGNAIISHDNCNKQFIVSTTLDFGSNVQRDQRNNLVFLFVFRMSASELVTNILILE